ncbi:MAG: maleate cis-trans isomerase [Betaproteobacteria bacterium]|jgi:maleate isomerase|nr:maleate cis-trans isomerase [Betaproteobacteria bacterium]MEA3155457.1 maleate isomerase [Betaproteobacteria bacterium]
MRHKLGIIVPSWNTMMEYETQRMAGNGTSVHTMRISHTADTEENVIWMGTQVPAAAKLLAHAKVDVICYGCTGGGFIKGPGYDQQLTNEIKEATGIPGTTTIVGVTDALRAFDAKKLCVASPYEPWLNDKLRDFLGKTGFEVLAIKGLGTQAHSSVKAEDVEALVTSVDRPDAQAIFISCTNFGTLDIIESLEKKLGKPVVTSNSASMWKMMRLVGDKSAVPGGGRLFREH